MTIKSIVTLIASSVLFCIAEGAVLLNDAGETRILNRQNHEWGFPPADPSVGRVVVSFRHRIDFPKPAGWCPCWQIEVNGKPLTAMATRSETRLLNKPYELKHRHHGRFVADNRSDKWYSLYLPEFDTADSLFSPPTPEASRVALDISDIVSSTYTNVVKIRCHVPRGPYAINKITDRKPGIVVGEFTVRQEKVQSRLPRIVQRELRASLDEAPPVEFSVERNQEAMKLSIFEGTGSSKPCTWFHQI